MKNRLFNPNHASFCWCNVNNASHDSEKADEATETMTENDFKKLIHEVSSYKYLGD